MGLTCASLHLFSRDLSSAMPTMSLGRLAQDVEAISEKGMLFADDLQVRLGNLMGLSSELWSVTSSDLAARPLPNQQPFFFRSRPGAAPGLQVKQNVGYKGATLARRIGVRE